LIAEGQTNILSGIISERHYKEELGLKDVAYTPIGDEVTRGISGAQQKRVNIAPELVAAPSAICLDGPASGLYSTAALQGSKIHRRWRT